MKTRATDEKGETKDIAESGSTKKATKEDVKKQTTVLMRTLSTIVQTLDDLPDNRHISMRVRCLQLWCHATNWIRPEHQVTFTAAALQRLNTL